MSSAMNERATECLGVCVCVCTRYSSIHSPHCMRIKIIAYIKIIKMSIYTFALWKSHYQNE